MSSSDKEEVGNSSQPEADDSKKGDLEENLDKIIDSLSQNVIAGGTTNQPNVEYEYEEYEIEEYEEEEEEIKNSELLSPDPSKKSTFMTQNIATMPPPKPKQPKPQNKTPNSPSRNIICKKKQKPQQVPQLITTKKPIEDPAETSAKLDLLIRDGTLPDTDSTQSVLHLINRRKVDALLSSDYESAGVYENAAQTILTNGIKQQNEELETTSRQNRQNRQQILQNKLKTTEASYNQQLESNAAECEKRLEEAEIRHQGEITEFKNNWKNPDYVKQFSKPSSRMLQLRYVEKKLALAKRYNDAVRQRKIGDKQQQVETEYLQKSLEQQMKNDFAKMREKQRIEIEKIEQHYDKLNDEIHSKMKKEIDSINFALRRNIEVKSKPLKNWSSPQSSQSDVESSLPTPRTKKKFNQYKQDRNVQIILTPFDDATLSKLPVTSLRSDRHKMKMSSTSRSSTALSTARSSTFASSRSKSSLQKSKTGKNFTVGSNTTKSHFPNLNS